MRVVELHAHQVFDKMFQYISVYLIKCICTSTVVYIIYNITVAAVFVVNCISLYFYVFSQVHMFTIIYLLILKAVLVVLCIFFFVCVYFSWICNSVHFLCVYVLYNCFSLNLVLHFYFRKLNSMLGVILKRLHRCNGTLISRCSKMSRPNPVGRDWCPT